MGCASGTFPSPARGSTVALRNRFVALVGGLTLVVCLPACTDKSVSGLTPSAPVTTSAGQSSGPVASPAGPGGATSASAAPLPSDAFVVAEGEQRDVCGVRLRVMFIPPSVPTSSADQAFLVGAPISGNQQIVPDPTGDQPLPSHIAPARPGATVAVLGKRFKIEAVDIANRRVRLEAVC